MPPLSLLLKPASGLCNFHCDYCFYCDEQKKREVASYGLMSEKTLKNVLRRCLPKAEGFLSLAFQGGEPTLRGLDFFERLMEWEAQYNHRGIPIYHAIQTNGSLLDEKWCAFLKKHDFLVGLSVDGPRRIHDRYRHYRGQGSFEKVETAAELMTLQGVPFNILTVVTEAVAGELDAVYDFYQEKGWNYQQYIACMDPLEEETERQPYSLRSEAYGDFLIQLFDRWYEDAKKGRAPYIRRFDNYLSILLGQVPEACEQRGHCSIQYAVEADGSVYPCDFYMLDEYRLGNFNEDQLEKVDEVRQRIGFLERSQILPPSCRTCPYLPYCRGGCRRNRDPIHSENRYCRAYFRFFEACLPRLQELAQLILRQEEGSSGR